nr:sensor histidine kinase [uncultured Anaerostipes sp.]
MTVITFVAFFLLLLIIEMRGRKKKNAVFAFCIYGMELLLCLIIIRCLYIGYNGIILLVVADIVTSIRDKHNRALFLVIMGLLYIFSDYNIISIYFKMISFQEFLNVYNSNISMILMGVRNMLVSLNILVFIVYMIILMRNQMKENARIALLNIQLETANAKLKEMNAQLQDYAQMQEKMGETKERNRIAREIHDTLGHTMTGLSAGIDACIAMIDFSVDETKKQLNKISKVARQGIQDIRRSVNKLRPDALEHLNLEAAMEKMMEEMMEVSDVQIRYECEVSALKFNPDEEDAIYRVVQEGITNAIRHGKAANIDVHIKKENKWLVLSIQDDGVGCEEIKSGFGLIHIRERIQMLNGEVTYDGSHGFHIVAKIPIRWGENYD